MTLYTDLSPTACAVLRARVQDGSLPAGAVLRADVRSLDAAALAPYLHVHLFAGIAGSPLGLAWAGWPDEWTVVTGGFPCQDISSAGKGAGLDGARSGLFWEMIRVISNKRPLAVFAENVGALSARGLDRVVDSLEQVGYEVEALRVGSWAVGSPQERERWWFICVRRDAVPGRELANVRGAGQGTSGISGAGTIANLRSEASDLGGTVDARREGLQRTAGGGERVFGAAGDPGRWPHARWCVIGDDGRERTVPTPQYEWEPPRLFEGTRTISARWRLALMGYPLHWLDVDPAIVAELAGPRVKTDEARARWWNKAGIEHTGNAQTPQVVAVLAAGLMDAIKNGRAVA